VGVNSLFNADDFLKLIKKTSMDAFIASKPTDVVFGKVISVSPLKIKIDQKLTLTSAQLVLSRQVTDYSVNVSFNWTTEIAGDHRHNVSSSANKSMTIHNGLIVGEEVFMIQMSGGQKYIVIDRIGKG
jgi:hypothetical protein